MRKNLFQRKFKLFRTYIQKHWRDLSEASMYVTRTFVWLFVLLFFWDFVGPIIARFYSAEIMWGKVTSALVVITISYLVEENLIKKGEK